MPGSNASRTLTVFEIDVIGKPSFGPFSPSVNGVKSNELTDCVRKTERRRWRATREAPDGEFCHKREKKQ